MKKSYWFVIGALVFTTLIVVTVVFRKSLFHSAKADIYSLLHQNTKLDPKWPSDTVMSISLLDYYYKNAPDNALWTGTGEEQKHNRTMLAEMLAYTDSLGLNEKDYHGAYIKTYNSLLNIHLFDKSGHTAETELIFTDAALSLLFQVAYGKDIDISYSSVKYKVDSAKIVSLFENLLAHHNWRNCIDSLEPKLPAYDSLKIAHNRMNTFIHHFPQIDSIDTSNQAAIKANAILKLRAYGVFPLSISLDSASDTLFNSALRNFQRMTGIDVTGKLNKKTLDNLRFPLAKRLAEIKRSINFWRWSQRLKDQKFVMVNVAATRIQVNDDSAKNLTMRVILGKPDKQTPLFAAYISNVVTYPHWVVPLSIETKEMLPLIKKDINYLDKNDLEVLDSKGNVLDPAEINWSKYSKNNFPFSIRQATGCTDALGVLKFDLGTPFDVYLHDTNARGLFGAKNRFLSHGCIRIEKPVDLAQYLLGDRFDADDIEYLNKCMKNQEPKDIRVKRPVPVLVYYMTADINENGGLEFYKDVYGLEK